MRNKLIGLLILFFAGLPCSHAADSTITITGNVRDNTCAVDANYSDFTVNLMSNAAKQYSRVGSVTMKIPFNIVLSPCGVAATAVKIAFNGTADTLNSTLLKIDTGSQAASGLGVEILDVNSKQIPVNATSDNIDWLSLKAGQTNTLQFYARLMATKVPVTAGKVSASATFIMEFQ